MGEIAKYVLMLHCKLHAELGKHMIMYLYSHDVLQRSMNK